MPKSKASEASAIGIFSGTLDPPRLKPISSATAGFVVAGSFYGSTEVGGSSKLKKSLGGFSSSVIISYCWFWVVIIVSSRKLSLNPKVFSEDGC